MSNRTIFSVVTQHGSDREVRAAEFGTWTEAMEFAESTNFMIDGSMLPNIDLDEIGDTFGEYENGVFHLGNKYAAIFLVGPFVE